MNFMADMLASVAKTLPSSLFSIGGDEVNSNCYTNDSLTQRELQESGKTFDQALSDFVQSNQKALAGIGKTPVVWEGERQDAFPNLFPSNFSFAEMVLSFNVSLASDTVVMCVCNKLFLNFNFTLNSLASGFGFPLKTQRR